jgi:hypothetical protein
VCEQAREHMFIGVELAVDREGSLYAVQVRPVEAIQRGEASYYCHSEESGYPNQENPFKQRTLRGWRLLTVLQLKR